MSISAKDVLWKLLPAWLTSDLVGKALAKLALSRLTEEQAALVVTLIRLGPAIAAYLTAQYGMRFSQETESFRTWLEAQEGTEAYREMLDWLLRKLTDGGQAD